MNKMVVFGAVGVLLLGGGAGGYMFLAGGKEEKQEEAAPKPPAQPVFLAVEPLSVPLPRTGKPPVYHYVTLNLQTTDEGKAKMNELMPRLRDAWLRDLNARPVALKDSPTEIDLNQLKQRILELTGKVMGEAVASDVLIVRTARGPS